MNTNILITNVGRRGYLVDYFRGILSESDKIYTSDCDDTASGLYGDNDGHFILPRPKDDDVLYTNLLLNLCKKQEINVVIPVIDPEIYILSAYRQKFLAEGINIIVSDRTVLDICFDKEKMNEFLVENGFLVPSTYHDIESFQNDYEAGKIEFPVYLKPILGSGSVETYKLEDYSKLKSLFHEGLIIQECLMGQEYGVDTFNTFDKKPVRCVVKKKVSMRSGETDKSITVEHKDIQNLMIALAKKLGHIANLDADVIETKKGLYVIDLNPRFGGGYPATYAAGQNYPELIVKLMNGEDICPDFDNYKKNLLIMKEIKIRTHQL